VSADRFHAILNRMPLDVAAIQAALREDGLDGWLLYDFHGSNPIAARLAGTLGDRKMTTRRWFYLVPASGEPRGLVHSIERHNLDELPGTKSAYAGRQQLEEGLTRLLAGVRRVAMEYSPGCAIPYVSRVDSGTIEAVRQRGVEVRSSGDLVQRFEARWDERALALHREASEGLYRVKDRAFETVARAVRDGIPTTEFDVQQTMAGWLREEGLTSDMAPVVATDANAGNPHYLPTSSHSRPIGTGQLLLLDLWAKRNDPDAVYADITWVGFTGRDAPAPIARAFEAVREARDAAIRLVQDAAREGRDLRGWQVDRAARGVLEQSGYGDRFLHRTGHSLGREVHGNGVHMDDYESHDDRRLLPGTGFTIEPGVYFDSFGVRSEINMFFGERNAVVTGAAQTEITRLA
jgi:Xaa-Pro dipeptidase